MNMCVPESQPTKTYGRKEDRRGREGEMVSLMGSRRHVGICVAVMMEKAVVVATAVIVASKTFCLLYGESERKPGRVPGSESIGRPFFTLGLRVSAP